MPVLPSPTAGRTACMTSVNVTDSLTRLPALTSSSPPRAVPFILWSSPSYSPSCSVHHRCRRCRLRCRRHFRRRPRYRRPHGLAHCVAASCLLYATFRPLRQPIRCPTVTVAVAIVVTAASIAILVSVAVSMCGPSSYMESTSVLTVIPGGRGTGRRSPELLLATPAPEPHECSEVRSLGEAWSFEYLSRYRLLVEGVGRCHLARVEGLSLPFPGPLLPCLSFYLLCTSLVLGLARFLLLRKRRTNGGVRVVCSKVIASKGGAQARGCGGQVRRHRVQKSPWPGSPESTTARWPAALCEKESDCPRRSTSAEKSCPGERVDHERQSRQSCVVTVVHYSATYTLQLGVAT